MALPPNFNYTFHTKRAISYLHNEEVRRHFSNTPADNLANRKSSLRTALTIRPRDTIGIIQLKSWAFARYCLNLENFFPPIMGIPAEEFMRESKFSPQIKIYFKEPFDARVHVNGRLQKRAHISFRIVGETAQTMNQTKAQAFANRVRDEFFRPNPMTWKKGKFKNTYLDIENGFDFRVFAISKNEARDLIQKAIRVAGKTFQEANLEFIENSKTFPDNPGTHLVYGRQSRKIQRRPTVDLRPTHSHLLINGRVAPVTLVSRGNHRRNALIYV